MTNRRQVVVAGSRFGQFYAAGIAQDSSYVLRGILSRGSARSRALSDSLGVEHWMSVDEVADEVKLACVAVGGAVRGEKGVELAEAFMARGIDVVIEHPLVAVDDAAVGQRLVDDLPLLIHNMAVDGMMAARQDERLAVLA